MPALVLTFRIRPMFAIAQLSDPHLPLPPVGLRDLLSKRATGWLSWTRRRQWLHRPEALASVAGDVVAAQPDHIVVTGDIMNISTAAEIERAADWFGRLGPPDRVTVIPGNHDVYVSRPGLAGLGAWTPYMAGDDASALHAGMFPAVRRRGPVALVSLNTAVPMPVGVAAGTLGADQIRRFEDLMRALAGAGLCRIVLIHHPPQAGAGGPRKGLTDAAAFRAAVGRVGAELILHGHNHCTLLARIATPDGGVPVLGAASASLAPGSHYGPGGYNLVRVAPAAGGGWTLDVEVRRIRDDLSGCDAAQRFRLVAPQPAARQAPAA